MNKNVLSIVLFCLSIIPAQVFSMDNCKKRLVFSKKEVSCVKGSKTYSFEIQNEINGQGNVWIVLIKKGGDATCELKFIPKSTECFNEKCAKQQLDFFKNGIEKYKTDEQRFLFVENLTGYFDALLKFKMIEIVTS
jgi:hypothetical protein